MARRRASRSSPFHMDYGTQAAKYIDAWFANLDWEAVDKRYVQVAALPTL